MKQTVKRILSVLLIFLFLYSNQNVRTYASFNDYVVNESDETENDYPFENDQESSFSNTIIDNKTDDENTLTEKEKETGSPEEESISDVDNYITYEVGNRSVSSKETKLDSVTALHNDGVIPITLGVSEENIESGITEIASGSCGETLGWKLTSDGLLKISGSGEMADYGTAVSAAAPWIEYKDQVTKIVIQEGVTSIGKNAFRRNKSNCLSLVTDVTIPESLGKIGQNAFNGLSAITTVNYGSSPNHWEALMSSMAAGNDPLLNVSSILYAKENAAITGIYVKGEYRHQYALGETYDSSGLVVIASEEGGTELNVTAKAEVAGFDSSELGEIVMTVSYAGDSRVFTTTFTISIVGDDAVLTSGTFGANGDNLTWSLTFGGTLTVSGVGKMDASWTGASEVPWYSYREKIENVVITDGVENVESFAFAEYSNLKRITLSSSVKTIGTYAFRADSALTEINLDKVVTISDNAFIQCTGLTSIDLVSAERIGVSAFGQCANLEKAVLGNTVVSASAFRSCTKLNQADLSKVTTVGDMAFMQTALTEIDLTNAESVSSSAFVNLYTLKTVKIGNKLESLVLTGSGITEVTIPGNMKSFMFNNCVNLETVIISEGVTEIGSYAFNGDTALQTLYLPVSVESVGESAFAGCTSLETIDYPGAEAQRVSMSIAADNKPFEKVFLASDTDVVSLSVRGDYKKKYAEREEFDVAGIVVIAVLRNGEEKEVTDAVRYTGFSSETVGEVTVTVIYGEEPYEVTTSFVIIVDRVEIPSIDLSGFCFTARNNYYTESYRSSYPVKQDDGTYVVDIPQQALTQLRFPLTISAPQDLENEFTITYTSYYTEAASPSAQFNLYTAAHQETKTSEAGVISIMDYYAIYSCPNDGLYFSDFIIKVGNSEEVIVKLKPCNDVTVDCFEIRDSVNGVGTSTYPVIAVGENAFLVSAVEGTELILSLNGFEEIKFLKNYNKCYINDVLVSGPRYTINLQNEEQSFNIRIVDEYYGIQECSFTLTVKTAELAMPQLFYNGEPTSKRHRITVEQYEELEISLEAKGVDENTTYHWYYPGVTPTDLDGDGSVLNFDTSNAGTFSVSCTATNIVDGLVYTSGIATFSITVNAVELQPPVIRTQPEGADYIVGNTADVLLIEIEPVVNTQQRWYLVQWYCTTNPDDSEGIPVGEPIKVSAPTGDAVGKATLVPSTSAVGELFYYCTVERFQTIDGDTIYSVPVTSEYALIRVEANGIELNGEGTVGNPYLIDNYEDLKHLHDLVNDGAAFNNTYFRMTADIALDSDWTPMGITVDGSNNVADADNLHAFSGIFDGDEHTLTIYPGGQPLLGYIESATVKNLNIYGERINGYGLVNNLYGVRIAGTGITVDNVTLKSGSSTLKSGLLGGEVDWHINPYSSASAHFMSYVSNCTIESGVVVGYDGSQSNIGSIAGSFNGIMENCVSYATVNGVDNVGGLVGYKDNSGGGDKFSVLNSAFYGTVNASGTNAGGIVGSGYSDPTAPNAGGVNIKNCTASGTVNGNKNVGGILGGEPGIDQLWDASYIQSNYFNGIVNGNENVGAIIGYMGALDKYNFIENNTFTAGCGSEKTYGGVHMVDTSAVEEGWHDGTYYYDSSKEHTDEQWDEIFDVMWQPWREFGRWKPGLAMNFRLDHNRDDDPLGVNGGTVTPVDPDKPRITDFTISGNYKTEYTVGDTLDLSGIVFTAAWSDGSTTNPSLGEVSYSGFDSGSQGERTIIFKYEGLSASFTYSVKPKSNKITVEVSILGDTVHGSPTSANTHTLMAGNLTTWLGAKTYEASTSDTVYDLLQRVFAQNGITFKGDSTYISALTFNGTNLGEFSNGTNSGWMYTVNGHHPLLSVGEQYLNDGDVIIFHYSDDYTVEEGSEGYDNTDAQAAQEVEALIEAIPTPVTPEARPAIEAARAAYDNLNYGQKAKVGNYDKLVAAEEALKAAERAEAEANATPADRAAAEAVEKLIDAIKTPVTADQADAVKAAREAYDKLTDLQKKLVDNLDKLEQAETALTSMKEEVNLRKIHSDTGDAIEAKGDLDVNGQWLAIGLARAGRKVNKEAFYASAEEYVKQEINEDEQLHWAKVTENARMVLALTALGYDPTDVAGHNLLMGMTDMEYVKMQGFNGPIWTLIAFDSNQYEIPENPDAKDQVTREKLISYLLENQLEDGGWALFGNLSDSDITGMTLQALAPYYGKRDDVTKAVDIALETLSRMQNADGSYSALGGDNGMEPTSESISQILVALSALGIDADKDPRFIKNGNSVLDALAAYYEDGGFKHVTYGKLNGMATEQAYYALTAYFRMLDGQTSLYDMTDVTVKKAEKPEQPEETADTSETSEEEDVALAVDAAEEAEEKTGISPLWIIPPVAAAGIIAFLVADRKRRKDKENAG